MFWILSKVNELANRLWLYIFDHVLIYPLLKWASPTTGSQFLNLGYWPTTESMEADRVVREVVESNSAVTDNNRPHYYLYEKGLSLHPAYPELKDLDILEVGCGHGHGMKWIKRAHDNIGSIQGVDREALPQSNILVGDAMDLPFPDNKFDIVLNVESSHLYKDCRRFFQECSRVLKPGGYICWIDLRYAHMVGQFRKDMTSGEMVELEWHDVTDNVLKGIEKTSVKYDQLMNQMPWQCRIFLDSFRATYCAPGTFTHGRIARKEKGYYVALWKNDKW